MSTKRTKTLTPAEYRSFVRGVRLVGEFNETKHAELSRLLDTRAPVLERYLSGARPIPQGSRVIRALVHRLIAYAMKRPNTPAASRLLTAARAFGDEVFHAEYREYEEWEMERHTKWRERGNMLAAGAQIAPFLSESGRMVVLYVDAYGRCGVMEEIQEREIRVTNNQQDASTVASTADLLKSYSHPLYGEGVHLAKWFPWESGDKGAVLIAIDDVHRLVALVEVPDASNGRALVSAHKDMTTALEIVKTQRAENAVYSDSKGYEDNDDDDYRGGDEWKIGTHLDPRGRR
jgi:hypothetical protein